MNKIIFIIPSVEDSHYKNRVIDFFNNGFDVCVYGFKRKGRNNSQNLPYPVEIIGEIEDEGYVSRLMLYFRGFNKIVKQYKNQGVLYFVGGLDIAMFFHFFHPREKYIYEECDLTHTYLGKIQVLLELIDKKIIKDSLITISTSEGFNKYHFKGTKPNNVYIVENKLDPSVLKLKKNISPKFCRESISFGFVGKPRFESVFNFIKVVCQNFPQHTFHIFGGPIEPQFKELEKYSNCFFHGFFKNPTDLPEIYSNINLVLSTYDARIKNVKYAEPNKIYESIYFDTPIIVSKNTFLGEKVTSLGIGYELDALNDDEIIEFVEKLTEEGVNNTIKTIQAIDKQSTININDKFFVFLKDRIDRCFL